MKSVKAKLKGYDLSGIDDNDNYLLKEEDFLNDLIKYRDDNL